MRRSSIGLFLIALSCTTGAAEPAPSAIDSDGRSITLAMPARRIVSLAPHATELLFAAGAGARVVGVSEYSDFPQAAKRLPRVASSAGVDLERTLALRPDLVVAWRFEATRGPLERLAGLGVTVFVSEPRQLGQIADNIEALGALAGSSAVARSAAAALRADLARLRATDAGRTPLRVFYQIADKPLMTVNHEHLISSVLELCGARNVFAQARGIAPVVNVEEVLAADPDVIVAGRSNPADAGWQMPWKMRYGALRAVREDRLVATDSNVMHRHGPRIVAGAEALCERLDALRRRAPAAAGRHAAKVASRH